MIFTRNLYEKGSVLYSLWYSLLNRDREQAKFWAYEFYYSGFKKEFFKYIWETYYRFYAYNNTHLEKFLLRRTLEWLEDENKEWIIGNIVDNLCLREMSLESWFMMCNFIMSFPEQLDTWIQQIEESKSKEESFNVIEKCSIHFRIHNNNKKRIIDSLRETFDKIKFLDSRMFLTACYARIMSIIFVVMRGKEKRLYLKENPEEIKRYKTPFVVVRNNFKRTKPKTGYIAHFDPTEDKLTIEDYENWLLYAYQSPIWKTRIEKCGGKLVDDEIVFGTDVQEEEFYGKYGMEPDEQPKEIQEKWLGKKDFESWDDLYEKYKAE